ncbi:uncharacterized protein LOC114940025 isoform X2 [Nylanderia fulva]|uniref:uncharacterized protein LOC114940025 isoform X2 n=1 Tax=Nylanderia fulva TaxID=613905 RepID=UPI0010FB48B8|nr:uncharacterized protein LOC114940025 isoform X2 [Nylanderia fulva]
MSNQGFVVAEFPDGIQVIPKIWLQNKDECKYPSHFKTDIKIRKAVEKQEIPKFDWPALEVIRIFGEYSSLQKAYAKAEKALYTSDMDTEKEAKYYRKHRARKIYSSSESEEESGVNLPPAPCPPAKHQRLNDSDVSRIQCKTTSNVRSSEKSQSSQITNSSSHSSFLQDERHTLIEIKKNIDTNSPKILIKDVNKGSSDQCENNETTGNEPINITNNDKCASNADTINQFHIQHEESNTIVNSYLDLDVKSDFHNDKLQSNVITNENLQSHTLDKTKSSKNYPRIIEDKKCKINMTILSKSSDTTANSSCNTSILGNLELSDVNLCSKSNG